jgi:uncharacterized protein YkwD
MEAEAMRSQAARKVHLDVEMLEDRHLLASHIAFAPSGVVTVVGSGTADHVQISYRGTKVRLTLSGGVRQTAQFARTRVKQVVIYANGGFDSWFNTTRIPVVGVTAPPAGVLPSASNKAAAPDRGKAAQTLQQQLNSYRQKAHLPALNANALLMQVAQAHADNMARQDKYGDTDTNGHILDGHDVVWRVAQVGYRWAALGENVAYDFGFADPVGRLMVQWWNSPEHRANMLGAAYRDVGIGIATSASGKTYGVMVFARAA